MQREDGEESEDDCHYTTFHYPDYPEREAVSLTSREEFRTERISQEDITPAPKPPTLGVCEDAAPHPPNLIP